MMSSYARFRESPSNDPPSNEMGPDLFGPDANRPCDIEFPEFQLRGAQVPTIYLSALTSWKKNQPSRDDDSLGGDGLPGGSDSC